MTMTGERLVRFFFPPDEHESPTFRAEIDRIAAVGLRVITGVCLGVPVVVLSLGLAGVPGLLKLYGIGLAIMAFGAILLLLSFWPPARRFARFMGSTVGLAVAAVQAWGSLQLFEGIIHPGHHFQGSFAFVLLVGMLALPLRPMQTMAFGSAMVIIFGSVVALLGTPGDLTSDPAPMVTMMVMTVAAMLMTGVVYRQRAAAFHARQSAEESFRALKEAQARLLVSENGASLARFAAAMSHELNTPLGAIGSSLDTVARAARQLIEDPGRGERLREPLEVGLRGARESHRRLREILGRLRHVTNLDRAERVEADLNELWSDTAALLRRDIPPQAKVELELEPLPPLFCRPQQMSAVFSNLLRNAAAALGDGGGTIRVVGGRDDGSIRYEVIDDGQGIAEERLKHLFDLDFRVDRGRVGTTNWGLFVSRSIIAEHGGEIEIASELGKGTTARIRLPLGGSPVRQVGSQPRE